MSSAAERTPGSGGGLMCLSRPGDGGRCTPAPFPRSDPPAGLPFPPGRTWQEWPGQRTLRSCRLWNAGAHQQVGPLMNAHDFSVKTADGGSKELRDYAGQVLLIVNVASQCGLTPQYEGLEALYRDDKDRGLMI